MTQKVGCIVLQIFERTSENLAGIFLQYTYVGCLLLLDMGLEGSNLLVDIGNVLFHDECELLQAPVRTSPDGQVKR